MRICLDPGHGLSNRKSGRFDSGAVAAGATEADIVMDWANELRSILHAMGHYVCRTRRNHDDPTPIGTRAGIAKQFECDLMLSLHCNAANGVANGTETFYRGTERASMAAKINNAVVAALGTRNRGVKTEAMSQHPTLAVMSFQPCYLLEIGFIDNEGDRAKMLDPTARMRACKAIADVLVGGQATA